MAQVLIDRGAKVDKVDNEGKSVLMVTEHCDIPTILLKSIDIACHFEKQ